MTCLLWIRFRITILFSPIPFSLTCNARTTLLELVVVVVYISIHLMLKDSCRCYWSVGVFFALWQMSALVYTKHTYADVCNALWNSRLHALVPCIRETLASFVFFFPASQQLKGPTTRFPHHKIRPYSFLYLHSSFFFIAVSWRFAAAKRNSSSEPRLLSYSFSHSHSVHRLFSSFIWVSFFLPV